jgi:hypothetical protein
MRRASFNWPAFCRLPLQAQASLIAAEHADDIAAAKRDAERRAAEQHTPLADKYAEIHRKRVLRTDWPWPASTARYA